MLYFQYYPNIIILIQANMYDIIEQDDSYIKNIIEMGNKHVETNTSHFKPQEWQIVETQQIPIEYGYYTTYENPTTHEQIDRYDMLFSYEEEGRNYYECFLQRLREQHIVNTIQYREQYEREFCATTYHAQVWIQHIPIRLTDITDIPFEESIYILKCALKGFCQLYSTIGYFHVLDNMIGIDGYGIVRVWMNSDFSKNYPVQHTAHVTEPQHKMVTHIVGLIGGETEHNGQIMSFQQYLEEKNVKYFTFVEVLEHLNNYVEEYHLIIPEYCQSILEIFNEEEQVPISQNRPTVQVGAPQMPIWTANTESNRVIVHEPVVRPIIHFESGSIAASSQQYLPPISSCSQKPSSKPIIHFNYEQSSHPTYTSFQVPQHLTPPSHSPTLPSREPSEHKLSSEKEQIVNNVLASLNIQLPTNVSSQLAYTEESSMIDPQIMADLHKYLQS